jgi:2-oxoglutarate ferredoxin oxidoreductase subunit beta
VPVGVFRDIEAPTFDELVERQVEDARAKGTPDFQSLLRGSDTWEVV